jgi:hypothetical protein
MLRRRDAGVAAVSGSTGSPTPEPSGSMKYNVSAKQQDMMTAADLTATAIWPVL